MAHDGVGHVLAALALQAQAEGDVDVLVIAEIPLVEAAGIRETARADRAPRRRRARSIRRRQARCDDGMAEAAAPRIAIGEIAIACAIELCQASCRLICRQATMRWDGRCSTARIMASSQSGAASASGLSSASHLPAPCPRADIVAAGKAEILVLPQDGEARRLLDDAVERAIGRGVVDDDGFEVREGLRARARRGSRAGSRRHCS